MKTKATNNPATSLIDDFWAQMAKAEKRTRDKHRKQYSDGEWHGKQRKGEPAFRIGDVVKFRAGGWGVIDEVDADCDCDRVPSYSVEPIDGRPFHPRSKVAWHYEGDFIVEHLGPVHKTEKAAH